MEFVTTIYNFCKLMYKESSCVFCLFVAVTFHRRIGLDASVECLYFFMFVPAKSFVFGSCFSTLSRLKFATMVHVVDLANHAPTPRLSPSRLAKPTRYLQEQA